MPIIIIEEKKWKNSSGNGNNLYCYHGLMWFYPGSKIGLQLF